MLHWIGVFQEGDQPWGDEIRVAIDGTEYGFVGVTEEGEELDMMPAATEEEAKENLEDYFADYETFRWLEEDD
jgi:hypothetical protein